MSNFLLRSISGLVYMLIILLGTLTNNFAFVLIFSILFLISIYEYNILLKRNISSEISVVFNTVLSLFSLILISLIYLEYLELKYLNILLLYFPILLIFYLFSSKDFPFKQSVYSLFGIIWIGFGLLSVLVTPLFFGNQFNRLILGVFILIWSNDTFAYLTGMLIGKNKIFERISPKKTWEGFIGGGLFTLLSSYLLSFNLDLNLMLFDWLFIGFIVFIFGSIGDFVESMIKREFKIKDSGKIMPGHGGILDRLDSFIFIYTFVFVYLLLR